MVQLTPGPRRGWIPLPRAWAGIMYRGRLRPAECRAPMFTLEPRTGAIPVLRMYRTGRRATTDEPTARPRTAPRTALQRRTVISTTARPTRTCLGRRSPISRATRLPRHRSMRLQRMAARGRPVLRTATADRRTDLERRYRLRSRQPDRRTVPLRRTPRLQAAKPAARVADTTAEAAAARTAQRRPTARAVAQFRATVEAAAPYRAIRPAAATVRLRPTGRRQPTRRAAAMDPARHIPPAAWVRIPRRAPLAEAEAVSMLRAAEVTTAAAVVVERTPPVAARILPAVAADTMDVSPTGKTKGQPPSCPLFYLCVRSFPASAYIIQYFVAIANVRQLRNLGR